MTCKRERMKIAASYRVNEPIRNLKIRVRVVQERSPLAELLADESEGGETRDSNFLEEEDRIFSWQDKVFSPFEIDFYADEKNCLTERQREYHRRVRDERLQGAYLYSYTENDSYYADDDLLTMPYRSYLSAKNQTALPAMRNRKSFRERYNKDVVDDRTTEIKIRSNHYLYTERTTMHVMADLSRRDEPATAVGSTDSETLLCTVTYDKARKLLTISPDFTVDDEQHYNVTNGYGVKFSYRIEHVSEERTPPELQEHREDARREVQQQLAYKEIELYKELQSPPANLSTLFISLDIASAHGFSYDGLFVTYFIDLPQHWSTKQKERLFGRTQKCRLENKTAHFSYCTDVSLHYPSNEFQPLNGSLTSSSLWPRLLFSVASLDSWTRYRIEGYAALPIPMTPGRYEFTISTWRAKGGIIDTLRRFFVGGSYELEDITCCGIPMNHEGKVLDKSNLNVVPSGNIKIYMNVIRQSGSHVKHFDYQRDDSDKASADTLMNNVENILEQFKAAKERMIRIRAMNS